MVLPGTDSSSILPSSIAKDMLLIEERIKSKLNSDAPRLSEIPKYLLDLGGKRIRPMLCGIVAHSLGMEQLSEEVIDVAAGIELIHMATLLHDDIIDNSPLRRHKPSPYKCFGLGDTLLSGDFLLVRAFSLCANLDSFIVNETERACVELTEGEILETPLHRQRHNLESALTIARKKTGSLFRLASICAAHLTVESPSIADYMARFGEHLGIAFQVLDDILDVTSDEDLLGKPSGTDIRERKPSVINVLWLESGDERSKRLLFEPQGSEDDFVKESTQHLRTSSVVNEARTIAQTYAENARNALDEAIQECQFPDGPNVAALHYLIEYVLKRVS